MILLLKGQVKAHTRRLKNGKVVQVKAHRRKGERKPQAAGRKTDRPQALTSPFPYRRDKYTPWLYITGDKKEVTRYLEERGYTGKVKDMGNNGILAATDGKQAQAILEGKGGKAAGGETERKMMPTAQAERQKTSEVAAKLGWMDSNGEPTVPFRIPITTGGLPAKGATALIDQRTQMPWAIPPKAIRHISELHQATAEQRTAFARALGDVLDAGLPRAVVERQKWFGIAPEAAGYKAAYYPAARGICVREDLIHDVAAYPDEPRVQQVFRQYLAHELHHEMDFDGEQVAHSHTSPLFEIRRDAVTQSPNGMTSIDMDKLGPVIKEMAAIWAYDQDGLRAMLDYPLLSLAPALLSWRDDFNPGERANWDYKVATVKSEVFAQAGALYYAMPDVLKQRAPTTYQLLENVYEATTLTDERERQSAVRTAFQPPGADLGNGPRSRATDRAGAKNGQAGQSVGRLSKGGHPRLGHSQSPLILLKAQVKAHTRRLKSGKVVQVNAYQNKRSKKAAPAKKGRPAAQPEPSTVRRIKQTETPAFKKWFGDSWVTESGKPGGKPLRVYHGTTQDFSEFQREQANPESDMGAGFYFTNEPEDVGPNYAGEGPDLNSKIQTLAGRIADDPPDDITEEEAENWDGDAAENYIREKYLQHQGAVMPVYLSLQNPVVIHPYGDSTWLDYDEGYDPDEDEYSGEPSGKLAEFIDALRHNASYMDDGSADDVIEEIAMHGIDNGGISAFDLMTMLRDDEGFSMLMDYDQDFSAVANEVFRQSLEDIGFDGVIDQSVDLKFGTQSGRRRPMKGMNPDTVHYIAFKPEQVKSATGNQGSFDPDDPSIVKGLPGAGPAARDGDAVTPKMLGDSLSGNPKLSSDLIEGASPCEHGLGSFDVPGYLVVLKGMRPVGDKFEVFYSVVSLVPVDMVDVLRSAEFAAKVPLHNNPVLKSLPAANGDAPVSISGDGAGSPGLVAAGPVAKHLPGFSDSGRRPSDGGVAVGAGKRNGVLNTPQATVRSNAGKVADGSTDRRSTSGAGDGFPIASTATLPAAINSLPDVGRRAGDVDPTGFALNGDRHNKPLKQSANRGVSIQCSDAKDHDITKASRGPLVVFRREPTPAQAKAGNYKVRRLNFQGLDISIETDAGQYRRGIDPNGKPWQTLMQHPYGYIRLTEGLDGDHFDVFIGPDEDSQLVFVADMFAPPDFDALDEQKAVLGCNSLAEAREVLLSAYDNPRFVGEIYQLSMDEFKYRIRHTRRDPQPLRFGGWIGVDLDGTLAHYDGWDGGAIGDPVPAMLARVKRWLQDGQDVRILTARVSGPNAKQQRRRIKAWARQHIGRALPVTSEKDHGMRELWDDRAVRVRRNQGVPW